MTQITRRTFVKQGVAGTSAVTLGIPAIGCASPAPQDPAKVPIKLGNTGLSVSRVAMGTGMRGRDRYSDQTKLGHKGFTELLAHGYDKGITLIDCADLYGSHTYVRQAMKDLKLDRDRLQLLTKIWFRKWGVMEGADTAQPHVDRFRKELGVDVIDVVFIHCVTAPDWPDQHKRIRDELSELKSKGVVRAIGCSIHTYPALKAAVESDWVDVFFGQINNKGVKMDKSQPVEEHAKLLKQAQERGKGVIGIKLYGEGTLVKPEERYASLKYVLENELTHSMSIGHTSKQQVDETMADVNKILKEKKGS